MILFDTNVLSALMRDAPDREVIRWLDRQPGTSVWTTSITVFEIKFGLETLASGKRRTALTTSFERLLVEVLQGRIAAFDAHAADLAANLRAQRQKQGRSGELRDTMIAAIALASHATLATRNVKHFNDIAPAVVNPWKEFSSKQLA